jgi:hypothetical protein
MGTGRPLGVRRVKTGACAPMGGTCAVPVNGASRKSAIEKDGQFHVPERAGPAVGVAFPLRIWRNRTHGL